METDKHKTTVIFRMFKGEVLALFPEIPGTLSPASCTFYAHVGQHGSAELGTIIRRSRLATPEEYRDLAKELTGIGYRLDIKQRVTPTNDRTRIAALRA